MITRIQEIAATLVQGGHIDNEADARLAAVKILLAAERLRLPVAERRFRDADGKNCGCSGTDAPSVARCDRHTV